MNKILCIVAVVFLISCGDKKQTSAEVVEVETYIEQDLESVETIESPIAIYDYQALKPRLEAKNDTTYIVNFWATWCKPCIKEMPYFEELAANYADQKVKVLFVSLDFPEKITKQIVPFIEKNNIKSEVVLLDDPDANGWIPKVSEEWSGAIPATIIYKNDRRKFYERSFDYAELETELKTIL